MERAKKLDPSSQPSARPVLPEEAATGERTSPLMEPSAYISSLFDYIDRLINSDSTSRSDYDILNNLKFNVKHNISVSTLNPLIDFAENIYDQHKTGIRSNGLEFEYIEAIMYYAIGVQARFEYDTERFLAGQKIDVPKNENSPGEGLRSGELYDDLKQLIDRVKDRPDLAKACLKFLDTEVTRPEYAQISVELTKARLDKEREQRRLKQARYRQRVRQGKQPTHG